jgi:hypothetical protein
MVNVGFVEVLNNNVYGVYFEVLHFFGYGGLDKRKWRTTLMKR